MFNLPETGICDYTIRCKGCGENIPAPVETMPSRWIIAECQLCGERRYYLPTGPEAGQIREDSAHMGEMERNCPEKCAAPEAGQKRLICLIPQRDAPAPCSERKRSILDLRTQRAQPIHLIKRSLAWSRFRSAVRINENVGLFLPEEDVFF